jgi:hypothetical protein
VLRATRKDDSPALLLDRHYDYNIGARPLVFRWRRNSTVPIAILIFLFSLQPSRHFFAFFAVKSSGF